MLVVYKGTAKNTKEKISGQFLVAPVTTLSGENKWQPKAGWKMHYRRLATAIGSAAEGFCMTMYG